MLIKVRSPDLLSGIELESDIFPHDMFLMPEFPAQHIGTDIQPQRLSLDDVQLRPSVITLPSKEPGNPFTTQGGFMTDLETDVIEEQVCFGMVGSALCRTSRRMRGTKAGADSDIAGTRKSQISRQGGTVAPENCSASRK